MFTGAELLRAMERFSSSLPSRPLPPLESMERVAHLANQHLTEPGDGPSAIFYATGRWGRVFGDRWVDFARFYAGAVAYQAGGRLVLTRETARAWLVEIASQQVDFFELRRRLSALTLPR